MQSFRSRSFPCTCSGKMPTGSTFPKKTADNGFYCTSTIDELVISAAIIYVNAVIFAPAGGDRGT
jgi:hypothetical protein